ncbi:MAG: hypothetical protein M5U09_03795, partial [Gammaproteobacteria bacterium]|nr:hypothetical protein [Gammaproteobacteria bacterium]
MASFIDGALPELVDDSDDDFRFTIELHWPPPDVDRAVEALGRFRFETRRHRGRARCPGAGLRDRTDGNAQALADVRRCRRRRTRSRARAGARARCRHRLAASRAILGPEAGGLLVARIGDVADATVRPVLETLARRTACGDAAGLFCDAPAGAAQAAIRYRVLAELMGV